MLLFNNSFDVQGYSWNPPAYLIYVVVMVDDIHGRDTRLSNL